MKNKQSLLNSIFYQIFVRNHSREGTFKSVEKDLKRIKELGANIIYLMPIHPIGKVGRKGTYGSPYAIQDYEIVDKSYGTMDDFKDLIEATHKEGMKIIIDVVFNHTSRDSKLLNEHPEWFYLKPNGEFGGKVGEWSDVYDLDHSKPGLDEYLSDLLQSYVKMGVDGFRFDVCSLLPASFIKLVRDKCDSVNENTIFLGECVDTGFVEWMRRNNIECLSPNELFEAGFDCLYHYPSWGPLHGYLRTFDPTELEKYKNALALESSMSRQENLFTRALENHDQERIASYSSEKSLKRNLFAFSMFTRGPGFIYAGEEYGAQHKPKLFEKDIIKFDITDKDYFAFVKKNINMKRDHLNLGLLYSTPLSCDKETLLIVNSFKDGSKEYGLFNLSRKSIEFNGDIPDGRYIDLLTGETKEVINHSIQIDDPLILIEF